MGIVQGTSAAVDAARTHVAWPGVATPRAHATAELEPRKDISFEGKVVRGPKGDSGTFCTASFCGKEADLWEMLVAQATQCAPCAAVGEGTLSTATVFLPDGDPRNGAHTANPDCAEGKCFCHALYGGLKPWGCAPQPPARA